VVTPAAAPPTTPAAAPPTQAVAPSLGELHPSPTAVEKAAAADKPVKKKRPRRPSGNTEIKDPFNP
jgi:hypothetical protein